MVWRKRGAAMKLSVFSYLLEQLDVETRQGNTEKFYDLIFQGMARQHENGGKYLPDALLPRIVAIAYDVVIF